jgi:hypothetical protein
MRTCKAGRGARSRVVMHRPIGSMPIDGSRHRGRCCCAAARDHVLGVRRGANQKGSAPAQAARRLEVSGRDGALDFIG